MYRQKKLNLGNMENCNNLLFFNTSIVKFDENNYIYAVRTMCVYPTSEQYTQDNVIIPGNDKSCDQKNIEVGRNFMWNRWGASAWFTDMTIFFFGNHKTNNLIQIGDFKDRTDVRITRINEKIFMHSNDLQVIKEVWYNNQTFSLVDTELSPINSPGINFPIVSIENNKVNYIDWFYGESNGKPGGVKFVYSNNNPSQYLIKFDKFIIDGKGSYRMPDLADYKGSYLMKGFNETVYIQSVKKKQKLFGSNYGITPLFSFTTPHIHLNNSEYGDFLIGVGHTKIHSDTNRYEYMEGSPIDKFRKNLYNDMHKKYKNKYIRHFGTGNEPDLDGNESDSCYGYIYMLYFYIIFNKNEKGIYQSMKMSDSYLPILLDKRDKLFENDEDYKFSLIFPMGLEKMDNNKIIVTCGYGDFYSVALEFNTDVAVAKCRHDIQNLDMNKYCYFILAKKGDKSYLSRSLDTILKKSSSE